MATLKLLSSMAPKACLLAAIELFEMARVDRVVAEAAGGVDVARRIESGETVDVVVLADDAIDKLVAGRHVACEGRMRLMSSGIAVAVRSNAVLPDLTSEASVKSAVLAAPSVSFSTGPSGRYLESLFARWGILDHIWQRIVVPPPGTPVAQLVAAGTVALGFQQLSEMLHAPDVIVSLLPAEIQHLTVFTGAVTLKSSDSEAARSLVAFLASAATDATKIAFGMSSLPTHSSIDSIQGRSARLT
jgi:molybdate transport system substrate-binding protein